MTTMATTTDGHVDAVCTALVRNAEQLAAVLRQISDPTRKAIGIWSIGETANHVAGSHEYFLSAARGEATLESLDEVDAGNARSLAEDPERDPSVLADRLEAGVKELVRYAGTVEGDPVVKPFIGVEVPLSTLLAIELGEVVVHGYDIARAAGLPWRIEPSDALVAHREFLALLPYLLDKKRSAGARVNAEIRIRGMDPFVVSVHDGILGLEQATGQKVDFTMSVDPAVYLLMYFNRVNPLSQMLRGKLLLWGRRPWKIQTFQSVFVT
jgi:uncharacterized protein (TIGR03083 family)